MKKALFLLILAMFLAGCVSTAKESEFFKHGSMYKNWENLKFSICGYKNLSKEAYRVSTEQDWWGKPITWKPEE